MTWNWKQIATVLTGTVLPAGIAALNGHPLTLVTLEQAGAAMLTTLIGVLLASPRQVTS